MPKDRITMTVPEGLWPLVKRVAASRRKSASEFASEAIMKAIEAEQKQMRLEALERMRQMHLPVGTPEEIEEQIERGRLMD